MDSLGIFSDVELNNMKPKMKGYDFTLEESCQIISFIAL